MTIHVDNPEENRFARLYRSGWWILFVQLLIPLAALTICADALAQILIERCVRTRTRLPVVGGFGVLGVNSVVVALSYALSVMTLLHCEMCTVLSKVHCLKKFTVHNAHQLTTLHRRERRRNHVPLPGLLTASRRSSVGQPSDRKQGWSVGEIVCVVEIPSLLGWWFVGEYAATTSEYVLLRFASPPPVSQYLQPH